MRRVQSTTCSRMIPRTMKVASRRTCLGKSQRRPRGKRANLRSERGCAPPPFPLPHLVLLHRIVKSWYIFRLTQTRAPRPRHRNRISLLSNLLFGCFVPLHRPLLTFHFHPLDQRRMFPISTVVLVRRHRCLRALCALRLALLRLAPHLILVRLSPSFLTILMQTRV